MKKLSIIPAVIALFFAPHVLAGSLTMNGSLIIGSNLTAQSLTLGGVTETNWPGGGANGGVIDLVSPVINFAQTGLLYRITLTNNASWVFTNHTAGRVVLLQITESGLGGWTNAWPAGLLWSGGNAIAAGDVSSNTLSVYQILDNGTSWLIQPEGLDYESASCGADCYALQFNGSNYITTDSGSQWRPTNFTFEAWVNSNQSQPNGGIGALASTMEFGGSGTHGWFLGFSDSGYLVFAAYLADDSSHAVYGTIFIQDGTWHHVAATYNGSNAALWVDGALDASGTWSGGALKADDVLNLGVMPDGWAYNYYGTMDEVRISSTVRYTGTFAPVYHPVADSDTVALWQFGAGTGTTAADITGNHNGTLQGSPPPAWVQGR